MSNGLAKLCCMSFESVKSPLSAKADKMTRMGFTGDVALLSVWARVHNQTGLCLSTCQGVCRCKYEEKTSGHGMLHECYINCQFQLEHMITTLDCALWPWYFSLSYSFFKCGLGRFWLRRKFDHSPAPGLGDPSAVSATLPFSPLPSSSPGPALLSMRDHALNRVFVTAFVSFRGHRHLKSFSLHVLIVRMNPGIARNGDKEHGQCFRCETGGWGEGSPGCQTLGTQPISNLQTNWSTKQNSHGLQHLCSDQARCCHQCTGAASS